MKGSETITHLSAKATEVDRLVQTVVASLEDDKAEDVLVLDLKGRSSFADSMVIATGRSQRQVGAMAQHLLEKLKNAGQPVAAEGLTQGDWVLIDGGDIVVHLFRPEVRAFYNLERLWDPEAAKRIADRTG